MTILNTFQIVWTALRAFRRESALGLFAVLPAFACFLLVCAVTLALYAGRTVERVGTYHVVNVADFVFFFGVYLLASLVILYFNAALVVAAYDRFEGSYSDAQVSIESANSRLGALFAWSALAATAGFVVKRLARNGWLWPRFARSAFGETWTPALVLPAMMLEPTTPAGALRRSDELFRYTWANRAVANFGFLIVYLYVGALALLVGAGLHQLAASTSVVCFVAAAIFFPGLAIVRAVETAFAVDLYYYSVSGKAGFFPEGLLRNAYVARDDRGRWQKRQAASYHFPSYSAPGR